MDWIYIDEIDFDSLKEKNPSWFFCDTRDFHCIIPKNPYDKKKFIPFKNNEFSIDEIKDYLRNLEEASGGKNKWRFLSFKPRYGLWCKYIRFKKMGDKYYGFVEQGGTVYPLEKDIFCLENLNTEDLGVH